MHLPSLDSPLFFARNSSKYFILEENNVEVCEQTPGQARLDEVRNSSCALGLFKHRI